MTGATPAERTDIERWMDWLLASINAPYLALFRDAKKKPEERGADWGEQCKTMIELLSILDAHLAKREWIALDKLTIADIALSPVIKRCLDFPTGRPRLPRWRSGRPRSTRGPRFRWRPARSRARSRPECPRPSNLSHRRTSRIRLRARCASSSACCCSAWWCSTSRARCAATSSASCSSAPTSFSSSP
jgi:hypothetical protein